MCREKPQKQMSLLCFSPDLNEMSLRRAGISLGHVLSPPCGGISQPESTAFPYVLATSQFDFTLFDMWSDEIKVNLIFDNFEKEDLPLGCHGSGLL